MSPEQPFRRANEVSARNDWKARYTPVALVAGATSVALLGSLAAGQVTGTLTGPIVLGVTIGGALAAIATAIVSMGNQVDAALTDAGVLRSQLNSARSQAAKATGWIRSLNDMSTDWYWEQDANLGL
jgi:hypothetical protein